VPEEEQAEPEAEPETTPQEEEPVIAEAEEEPTGILSGISLAVILLAILVVIGAVYFLLVKGKKK